MWAQLKAEKRTMTDWLAWLVIVATCVCVDESQQRILYTLLLCLFAFSVFMKKTSYMVLDGFLIFQMTLFVYQILSNAWAHDHYWGLLRLFFLSCISSIAMVNYIQNDSKFNLIANGYIVGGFCLSVIFLFLTLKRLEWNLMNLTERVSFPNYNANMVALVISISILFSLHKFMEEKRWILLPVMALFALIIVITGSKKGFLMVGAFVIFYLCFREASSRKILRNLLIGFVGLCVVLILVMKVDILYNIIGKRLESTFLMVLTGQATDLSDTERWHLIDVGIKYFLEKPFLGHGMQNYRARYFMDYSTIFSPHNNYIELLVGLGLVGAFLYYARFILTGISNYNLFKLGDSQRGRQIALISTIVVSTFVIFEMATIADRSIFIQMLYAIMYGSTRMKLRQQQAIVATSYPVQRQYIS